MRQGAPLAKKRASRTPVDVKSFRHSVALLKKKGLVSKRVDARSQKPTKYMRAKVRKLSDVLSGHAVAIKLKPSVLKQYREAGGFNIVNRRLAVSKELLEEGTTRGGLPILKKRVGQGGIERLILPYGSDNILQFIEDAIREPDHFNKMKYPEEYFTFKYRGNYSRQMFDNAEWLADYMSHYDPSGWYEEGVFERLEVFRADPDFAAPRFKYPRRRRQNTKTVQDRRQLSWASSEEKRQARDKRFREAVKNDPVRLAKKREADKARALRYRIRKGAR